MCLIIYAPNGQEIPKRHFWQGAQDNNDGIGIMSQDGVEKFLGRKKTKRAYAYARQLVEAKIAYAVHFRFATHGRISKNNTHPFEIPGTDHYMMHNGILWTASASTDELSDTALFARDVMPTYMAWKESRDDAGWKDTLALEADYSRLLLMSASSGKFDIINETLGDWLNGLWYSNTHSLAMYEIPRKSYFTNALSVGTVQRPSSFPMASGPTMRPEGSEDYEDWFYRARSRELRRTGFDWHDTSTWSKWPIPGSWDDRFPMSDERDTDGPNYGAACSDGDDDEMDGVQEHV